MQEDISFLCFLEWPDFFTEWLERRPEFKASILIMGTPRIFLLGESGTVLQLLYFGILIVSY